MASRTTALNPRYVSPSGNRASRQERSNPRLVPEVGANRHYGRSTTGGALRMTFFGGVVAAAAVAAVVAAWLLFRLQG